MTTAARPRGTFAEWQPRYAEVGIATFPVRDKTPAVTGYLRLRLAGSRKLVHRFPGASAFGLALKPSGITVIDVDAPDELILADALARHGNTPFIVRSGSGHFQAWYRRRDEGRRIRPNPAVPVDILGNGFVVAPPSIRAKGQYAIIQGSLADLCSLPLLRHAPEPGNDSTVGIGRRNDTLWRHCMGQARYCDDFDAMLDVAASANASCLPSLPDAEVVKVARSAWDYTQRGKNRFGGGQHVLATYHEVDGLLYQHPDAFTLLMILRRRHSWRDIFVVANAMCETMPGGGWTRKRFSAARQRLKDAGMIVAIHAASLHLGPAEYRFSMPRA